MALVTAAEARLHLPHLTGTGEDTDIDTVITRVGVLMAQWCHYPPAAAGGTPTMESATYTHYFDGPSIDSRVLRLPVIPVTSVTSVHWDSVGTYTYSQELSEGTDFVLDGEAGELLLHPTSSYLSAWPKQVRGVKVVYAAGWATPPGDIEQACILWVRHLWDLRRKQGEAATTQGDGTVTNTPEVIPPHVAQILSTHILPQRPYRG